MPLFGCALVIALALQQDVKVEARLSPPRIAVGETATLRIDVRVGGGASIAIDAPPLPDGLVVLGTQDATHLQMQSAGSTRVAQRAITLTPSRAGEYMLPAIPVTVDGRRYYSPPLTLLVDPPAPGASGRVSDAGPTGDDVRLRVRLSPATVYVGQQAVLEVEALFPRDLRQRQSRPASFDTPSPPGFWVSELPGGLIGGVRVIEGTVYETQTYRRAYFPLESGRFDLAPARLRYELRRAYLLAPESRELVSDSPSLTVLPLPESGRPPSFTGAVGRYTLQAFVQPSSIAAGDAAVLTAVVRGTGNVKALPAPRLPALPGVEIYPPSQESEMDAENGMITGVKRFSWVLIPERSGSIAPGPIEYGFFDPETERYAVARSGPVELAVLESGSASDSVNDIRGVHGRAGARSFAWVRSPLFAALQVIPLLLLIGAWTVRRSRHGPVAARRRARFEREAALEAIRAAATTDSDREFLGKVAQWVRTSAAEATGRPELRTAPAERARAVLMEAAASAYAASAAVALLRRLDQARFAETAIPFAQRDAMMDEARAVIARIVRDAPRTGAALVVLTFCLATPVPGVQPDSAFSSGIAAYVRGNHESAVRAFEAYTRASPADADGWYNLGNAYHHAGNRGRAIWAWRRALEIDPRLADARHNLDVSGAALALASAPSPLMPTTAEAGFGLALLWWIGGIAGAVRLIRGTRAASALALACATIFLALTLATLPGLFRPATVIALETVPLRLGPDYRSETVLSLPPGAPLELRERRGDWLLLRTIDRAEGWAESQRFGSM